MVISDGSACVHVWCVRVDTHSNTALHLAIGKQYKELAETLADEGANLNIQNNDGC